MHITKLLSISSAPIAKAVVPEKSLATLRNSGGLFRELAELLPQRNGFYAFENALHLFPLLESSPEPDEPGLEAWNERGLWKDWYHGLVDGMFFFSEDVFGGQFAIRGEEIVSFDPESGEAVTLARSIEGWAKKILSNYRDLTGFPIESR